MLTLLNHILTRYMRSQQKRTEITHYKERWNGVRGLDGDL